MKLLVCCLVFAAIVAAQPRCSIRGTVVDALTNQPLAKAEVFADSEDDSGLPVRRITDSQGAFCFEGLAVGDYTLKAKHARYIDTNYGELRPNGPGEKLHVGGREPLVLTAVKMAPQAVISGVVIDDDGDPVEAAQIYLLKPRWVKGQFKVAPVQGAVTDDQGRYRLAGLPAGAYFIMARPAREGSEVVATHFLDEKGEPLARLETTIYYKSSLSVHDAAPIRIKAGQELSGVDMTLRKVEARHLSGQVSAELLNTSPRILYLVEEDDDGPQSATRVLIHDDGTFRAEGLAASGYRLLVVDVREEVDLTSGSVDGLAVQRSERIGLRITITPIGAESRQCSQVRGLELVEIPSSPEESIQSHGTLRISDNRFTASVRPGNYKFKVVTDGPQCFIERVLVDGVPHVGRTLRIEKGNESSIELFIGNGVGSIEGQVAPAGDLKHRTTVFLEDELDQDSSQEKTIGVDGRFQWDSLQPGKYRLYAFEDFDGEAWGNPQMAVLLAPKSREIEVKEGKHATVTVPLISFDEFQDAVRKTDGSTGIGTGP